MKYKRTSKGQCFKINTDFLTKELLGNEILIG